MRPLRLLAALFALAPVVAPAQSAANDPLLLRLTTARVLADFKADRAALDTLLADDVAYGRSSGVLDTKAEVLKEVGPGGPYELDYLTPDSLRARRFGTSGVVNGILHVKLKAQKAPYRIRFTDVWALRRGRWQLVSFQATRLPEPASATPPAASRAGEVQRLNPTGLSAPAGFTHVVVEADDMTTFLTDMRNVATLRDVRARYDDAASLPASTAVQVTALARPEFLIEIEATALIP